MSISPFRLRYSEIRRTGSQENICKPPSSVFNFVTIGRRTSSFYNLIFLYFSVSMRTDRLVACNFEFNKKGETNEEKRTMGAIPIPYLCT